MKNEWLRFFVGKVYVKLEGKGTERVLNELIRQGISLWNVKRVGTEAVTFYLSLRDLHNFRRAIRPFPCKASFIRGQGTPFLIKRSIKNAGFAIGTFLFFIIIMLLSNMVWGIQIEGASPQTEHQIRKELTNMGLKPGKLQFSLPNVEAIQQDLSYRMDNITWVGVELKGTTYHFQVVEKNVPEETEKIGPRNLVAKKEAVIVELFVEEGQPMVELNQFVKKGQLLVSGLIGKEEEYEKVPSKARIMGETWYKTDVTLPLKTDFEVFSGNETNKHMIMLGNFSVPIWGFGSPEYKNSVEETNEHPVKFMKWTLPITYVEKSIKEKENVTRQYSKEEAIQVAKELAQSNLEAQLPEEAEVLKQKILQQKVENGKVNLTIHFKVLEDIAIGQPIIQGD